MDFEEDMGLTEVGSGGVDRKTEAKVTDGKSEKGRKVSGNSKLEKLSMREDESARYSYGETDEDKKVMVRSAVSNFNDAYAMVDEGAAARMSEAFGSEAEKALSYGFEPGDMVWGKVKSHPWWPGHVFNEAFASASVRRTKRQGHLLVAFFGDSSYGWFEPEELVPFEPHYAEKSRQTNSRSFAKAVFEAIDEASRRCALGLTCRCRNPFNFRPMNVSGYFAVDVGGYESGAVYSVMQIKKARERFQTKEALQFVQQLALMPMSFDKRNMDAIKNKATIYAYRKAAFEEFDETYAQAFGMQPVRPGHDEMGQAAKMRTRAPLTGPAAISEPLVESKHTPKPTKVKELLKKDKYLFKRRDEVNEPRPNHQSGQIHESIPVSSASAEEVTPGEFVFQKRTPVHSTSTEVPVKQDGVGIIAGSDSLGQPLNLEVADVMDKNSLTPYFNLTDAQLSESHVGLPTVTSTSGESALDGNACDSQVLHEDERQGLDKENVVNRRAIEGGTVDARSVGPDADTVHNSSKTVLPETVDDLEGESLRDNLEDLQSQNQTLSMTIDDQLLQRASDKDVLESSPTISRPIDSQSPRVAPPGDAFVKKTKTVKHPAVGFSSERSMEKKKKRKKESNIETSSEHLHKRLKTKKEDIPRMSAGRSIGIGLPQSEKSQLELQQVNSGSGFTSPSDSALSLQKVDLDNIEVEIPQVIHDLLALALDPFYGIEGDNHAVVRQVLLRFRSHVYQKSLVLPSPSEADTSEFRVGKPTMSSFAEIPSGEDARSMAPKNPRQIPRSDDPTKSGRKRSLSDRQEENSAKRLKKLHELKSLTERRAHNQKIREGPEQKDNTSSLPSKPAKVDTDKKVESTTRGAEPAMLVLKFPQSKSLPSSAELKARFSRFGPLDLSAMRVFYKTNTCRVVFQHKVDAKAAYNYAVRNNALFGHVNVNYQLRDVVGQAPPEPEAAKVRQSNGAAPDETLQLRPTSGGDSVPGPRSATPVQRSRQSSNSQLKSCLKKPSGDEVGPVVNVPREVPRVKFMLSGEESNRAEQLMVSNSKDPNTTGSSADGGASSVALDVNSKNLLKFTPPTSLLPFTHHAPDVRETHSADHRINAEPINFNNYFNATATTLPPPPPIASNTKVDISHQMLNLLRRCSDIVTDVKCSFGYMPYHPL